MKGLSLAQPIRNSFQEGRAQSVSRLGILLSLALILQLVEGMLPPIGLPGIKLGLANTVILLALLLWGWKTALTIVLLRQIVGGLLTGKLLSIGFYFGLVGGITSILVMQLWLYFIGSQGGLAGTSMAGALAHNWGQWVVARWLISHQAIIWYLPFLTLAALPCGLLVAFLCRPLIRVFGKEPASFSFISPKAIAILLVLTFLGTALPFYGLVAAQPNGTVAKVQVKGQIVKEFDLSQDGQWEMNVGDHRYMVMIREGGISISQSDCHDQVCVQTGRIRYQGQAIVCVPRRLIITIENQQKEAPVDGFLP